MKDSSTSTSKWSLVIHRVNKNSAEVWVGTLFPDLAKPHHAKIELRDENGMIATHNIDMATWERPFDLVDQRFYCINKFNNLKPNTTYSVSFSRRIEAVEDIISESWQVVKEGLFDTLPTELPVVGQKPFTIGLASCFYNHKDGGNAAESYKALYEYGDPENKPDITFLTGDQVYLDIGFDSLSLLPNEIRQRIADDYAEHWQALGSILSRGGTWMFPDDHEYWNDYPFYDSYVPTLLALKIKNVRDAWKAASKDGVQNIQRSVKVEHFSIGADLSICLVDCRSYRTKTGFVTEDMLLEMETWARTLQSPGVLVLPQPLIVSENHQEKNLRSYPEQYQRLLKALADSTHDIVLMSGDVHFGRIATVELGTSGKRLIEIIASPLSNLTGLNGVATSVPETKIQTFPDGATAEANGWIENGVHSVKYECVVDTVEGSVFSSYPKTRSKEHFMTIAFAKAKDGSVQLTAKAWSVREREGEKQLPKSAFRGGAAAFEIGLS